MRTHEDASEGTCKDLKGQERKGRGSPKGPGLLPLSSQLPSRTFALCGRFITVSGLKSFLFFRQSTAVMMIMMTVTTAMGASTAAMIHRLLGGFFTTAAGKSGGST